MAYKLFILPELSREDLLLLIEGCLREFGPKYESNSIIFMLSEIRAYHVFGAIKEFKDAELSVLEGGERKLYKFNFCNYKVFVITSNPRIYSGNICTVKPMPLAIEPMKFYPYSFTPPEPKSEEPAKLPEIIDILHKRGNNEYSKNKRSYD